jgi:hypothetical protein
MFSVYCAGHDDEVLLDEGSFDLHNTDDGIVVTWSCPCGTDGSFVTGRKARLAPAA